MIGLLGLKSARPGVRLQTAQGISQGVVSAQVSQEVSQGTDGKAMTPASRAWRQGHLQVV
jgi:hypothetical protein